MQAQDSLVNAVLHRDRSRVEALIERGQPVDERDHTGATAFHIAAHSDQFEIAELLLAGGADPYALDSFYIAAASGVADSKLLPGTPDGDARVRLEARLKELGVPMPPPSQKVLREMYHGGEWPARSAPPPLPQ